MMKKMTRRLIAILLSMTLVLASGSVAFAAEEGVEAGQVTKPAESDIPIEELPEIDAKLIKATSTVQPMAATPILTHKINTLTEYQNALAQNLIPIAVASPTPDIRALSLQKGTVVIDVVNASSSTGTFKGTICTDEEGNVPVAGAPQLSMAAGQEDFIVIDVPAPTTYFLKSEAVTGTVNAAVGAYNVNGNNRAIANYQQLTMGQKVQGTKLMTFTAPYTGYVDVFTVYTYGNLTLKSSSGKALSNPVYIENGHRYYNNTTFGVKKGSTYYFAMNSTRANPYGFYVVYPENKKVTEKSGSKKSKAVTIKKKGKKKGTITAGSSKADWYKLSYKSGKSFKVTVRGYTNDKIKYNIYKGNKKIKSNSITRTKDSYIKLSGKAKGTYYIKVYRGNSTSSGYYSITWK